MTRKTVLEVGKYYHIYNRGTDKRKIFMDKGDLYYFFDSMFISNAIDITLKNHGDRRNERKQIIKEIMRDEVGLVEIVAYALLPNHFHFILKETWEGGISKFMQRLSVSYTKYFNAKYDRSGVLFQGKFKASLLAFDGSLERTSAYVNLNFRHHEINLKKELVKTSLFEYLGEEKGEKICNKKEIENIIEKSGGLKKYKRYISELSDIFLEEHKNK